jgi:sulfur carrier protein
VTVLINGESREVSADATVSMVVQLLGLRDLRGVAVARNGAVILRADWESAHLSDGDRIEVLQAVQGG